MTSTPWPTRLQAIVEHADSATQEEKARRDEARAEQTARKEALAAEAEELASHLGAVEDGRRPDAGHPRRVEDDHRPRPQDRRRAVEALLGGARDVQPASRLALRRTRPGTRGAKQAKEALCERAEELCDSTDWGATSATFRDLLTEWKAAGRASKDVDDALWHRFKAAQDKFFSARNAATSERDAEFRANAEAKEALLAEAERIDTSDVDAAQVGAARRSATSGTRSARCRGSASADLERRLRAVEKKIRDTPTGGVDPEAKARADQFRVRAEQFERQAEKAAAAGRTKDAEQARASAEQWRQWADAAADALSKKR